MASEASRKILLKMNILCANFLDKSAYWVRKISLGKIIGGGGARAPCAPGSYAHALLIIDTVNFDEFSLPSSIHTTLLLANQYKSPTLHTKSAITFQEITLKIITAWNGLKIRMSYRICLKQKLEGGYLTR